MAQKPKKTADRSASAEAVARAGARTLKAAGEKFSWTGGYRLDADELLTFALGHTPDPTETIPPRVRARFEKLVARRALGEPVPYITGTCEFAGLAIGVRRGAFVPRLSTEFMAAQAVKRLARRRAPVHVDLACGVGPVALTVASKVKRAKVHGVDLAPPAVAQARANATALRLKNATFYKGDLFTPLPKTLRGKVDLITIHPPYVATHEVRTLPDEIRKFEPVLSLTDGSRTGLRLLSRTAEEASEWLVPGGWLLVEIGSYLARDARSAVAKFGDWSDLRSIASPHRYTRLLAAKY